MACEAALDNVASHSFRGWDEHGRDDACRGVPDGRATAQLQRGGTRTRRVAFGGESVGEAARGAARRGAPHAYDAKRVADGCRTAPGRDSGTGAQPAPRRAPGSR